MGLSNATVKLARGGEQGGTAALRAK